MPGWNLIEHPEGGRYREVYRSAGVIRTSDRGERRALTHIYFSLRTGEVSRFHRLCSDEVWNLYRGEGLRVILWDGESNEVRRLELSASSGEYCCVIPAGTWQAAEPIADEVLVGCSVAPGYEYEDFELLERSSSEGRRFLDEHIGLERFLGPGPSLQSRS